MLLLHINLLQCCVIVFYLMPFIQSYIKKVKSAILNLVSTGCFKGLAMLWISYTHLWICVYTFLGVQILWLSLDSRMSPLIKIFKKHQFAFLVYSCLYETLIWSLKFLLQVKFIKSAARLPGIPIPILTLSVIQRMVPAVGMLLSILNGCNNITYLTRLSKRLNDIMKVQCLELCLE